VEGKERSRQVPFLFRSKVMSKERQVAHEGKSLVELEKL
jgi:hypothetical protein